MLAAVEAHAPDGGGFSPAQVPPAAGAMDGGAVGTAVQIAATSA